MQTSANKCIEGLALFVVIGGNILIKFANDSWVKVTDLLILDVSVTWTYEIGISNLNDSLYPQLLFKIDQD